MSADSALAARARARRSSADLVRHTLAASLVGASLIAVAEQSWYRGREAAAAAWLTHTFFGFAVLTRVAAHTFYFGFQAGGRAHYLGLEVSLACSSILLLAAAAAVTAILAVVTGIRMLRLLAAAAAASVVLVAVNQIRLVLMVILISDWGVQVGFGWGHTFFGTLLTLGGLSAAVFVYYRIVHPPVFVRRP